MNRTGVLAEMAMVACAAALPLAIIGGPVLGPTATDVATDRLTEFGADSGQPVPDGSSPTVLAETVDSSWPVMVERIDGRTSERQPSSRGNSAPAALVIEQLGIATAVRAASRPLSDDDTLTEAWVDEAAVWVPASVLPGEAGSSVMLVAFDGLDQLGVGDAIVVVDEAGRGQPFVVGFAGQQSARDVDLESLFQVGGPRALTLIGCVDGAPACEEVVVVVAGRN